MDCELKLASQKAVVIFSKSTCCMCVSPMVYELDELLNGREIERALVRLGCSGPTLPAVFVGGKLVGSTKNLLTLHINGTLEKMLKDAGALWL
ncbi:hypothetical protein ABFS83_03G032000 [Erythranthe nasuta]